MGVGARSERSASSCTNPTGRITPFTLPQGEGKVPDASRSTDRGPLTPVLAAKKGEEVGAGGGDDPARVPPLRGSGAILWVP
jgi:hypothetical protein